MNGRRTQLFTWTLICAALVLLKAQAICASTVVDQTQTSVQVVDHPVRIITLAPSLAETVVDLIGHADIKRIVGVSETTDYPPALKQVPVVGFYQRFNLEKVMSLKPDLILATEAGNSKDQVLHLRELKLPVVIVSTETLQNFERSIRVIATVLGADSRGSQLISELHARLRLLAAEHSQKVGEITAGSGAPRVFLQLGDEPIVTAGGKTLLNELLSRVGIGNTYEDAGAAYPRPTVEDVIRRDPDQIIIFTMGSEDPALYEKMKKAWLRFPHLKAVKNGKVFIFNGDLILRPTLRFLDGLSRLENLVYAK